MIRLDGGYAIDVDSMNYVVGLAKKTKVVNSKTGVETEKEILDSPKYYSTLDAALMAYWKMMRRKSLYDFEGSLKEALDRIDKQDAEIRKLIDRVKEGYEE